MKAGKKIKVHYLSWRFDNEPDVVIAFGESAREIRRLLHIKSGYYEILNHQLLATPKKSSKQKKKA